VSSVSASESSGSIREIKKTKAHIVILQTDSQMFDTVNVEFITVELECGERLHKIFKI
jgi:hypothetical protein